MDNSIIKNFKSGYKKSKIDPKKKLYCAYRNVATTLPTSVDLRADMSPVRNQGKAGSCVSFGTDAVMEYFAKKLFPKEDFILSPMFIYSSCKQIDGSPDEEGTQPNIALGILQSTGVCLDSTLPYNDQITYPISFKPTEAMLTEAGSFRIKNFAQCQNVNDIKTALVSDGPVVGAMLVFESTTEPEDGKYIGLPGSVPDDSILGGHCICLCGYDDTLTYTYADGTKLTGFFILRNSWGTEWGMSGYAYLPYAFLTFKIEVIPGEDMNAFEESWSVVEMPEAAPDESKVESIELWVGSTTALVNHIVQTIDQSIVIDTSSNCAFAPVRFVFEAVGYTVTWNPDTKTVTAIKGSDTIVMTVGKNTVLVNGKAVAVDQSLVLVKQTGRVLAPVRFVFEAVGYAVAWNESEMKITATKTL